MQPKPWTPEEWAVVDQILAKGGSGVDVAQAMKVTYDTAYKRLSRFGRKFGWAKPPGRFDWTKANLDELMALWAMGLSLSECAAKLDPSGKLSRCAVGGKVFRLGLQKRDRPYKVAQVKAAKPPRPVPAPKPPKPPKPNLGGGVTAATIIRRAETPPVPLPNLREITTLHARPWVTRQIGECHWPVSGEGADTLSCCAPTYKRGWCREHAKIGLQPAKQSSSTEIRRVA